jgi:MinD-like ATPase involved in chromosome partitioning or flagellar assembly
MRPQVYQPPSAQPPVPLQEGPPYQGPPPPLPSDQSGIAAPLGESSPVRYAGDRPSAGWQGRVYAATAGRVNPGLSPAQRARQAMIQAIRRPLRESHRVAVMSVKGGVGKTTVAACLGLVMAENRGDRVIALDANPDAGTLADRLTGRTPLTVRDLLNNIADATSLTEVDRFTTLAGRLQVLASEQDPAAGAAFSRDEYAQVCEVLARFANIVVTDSGTGLVHSAMEGTLALADSLVVVGAPTLDGAGRASMTLDWLAAHGQAELARRSLVVLSCDRWSRHVDRAQIRAHFEARCRGVIEIPFDPYLAIGGRIQLPALQQATIDAFLLLAARVADGFEDSASPSRP